MRVTLLHNPEAGDRRVDRDHLVRALLAAGHAVTYQSTKEKDYRRALEQPGDVVLVAGGDGTVGKVGGELFGRGVPLALLPLGTANNIAKTLGIRGSPEDLISQLAGARRRPFDAGRARGPWGDISFLEAVGFGFFPRMMCTMKERGEDRDGRANHEDLGITRDIRILNRVLSRLEPQGWQIEADGDDLSGDYLVCQVMNIRSVGPNLRFAPQADPGDGFFDLVLAGEIEREQLRHYLEARVTGGDPDLALPSHRVRHVRITAPAAEVHVDDEIWRPGDKRPATGGLIEVTITEGALQVLIP